MAEFLEAKINFDSFDTENGFAILHELNIKNPTDRVLSNIGITMKSEPELIKPKTWLIDKLEPEEEKAIKNCIVEFDEKHIHKFSGEIESSVIFTFEADYLVLEELKCPFKVNSRAIAEKRGQKPVTRLDIWQKKLLNLSLNNPLLNCKINKTNLLLLCPNPGKLEDYLADGEKISLESAESIFDEPYNPALKTLTGAEKILRDKAEAALLAKKIPVNLPEKDLQSQTVALYRKTKSLLEEGGSNTLYLAIGFLNGKTKDKKGSFFHAPLILCPVKTERVTVKSGVKISAHEDESRFNTTLLQFLKQEFALSIPELEDDLPTDESGLDVYKILSIVKAATADIDDFSVTDEVILGNFSFNKYLMWKDLTDRNDRMMKNPVVCSLINKTWEGEGDKDFPKAEEIDFKYSVNDFYLPYSADASQSAVIAAADAGKSFVIEGPPGTGKSRTIANLIAHLIAKGQKVLFVSEKLTALNVVYENLEKTGLGRYCLELHSNKANKKDVLLQLKRAWESAAIKYPNKRNAIAKELDEIKNKLISYNSALYKPSEFGIGFYEAFSKCEEYKIAGYNVKTDKPFEAYPEKNYDKLKEIAHDFAIKACACNALLKTKGIKSVTNPEFTPDFSAKLLNAAEETVEKSQNVREYCNSMLKSENADFCISGFGEAKTIYDFILALNAAEGHDLSFIFGINSSEILEEAKSAFNNLKVFDNEAKKLNCNTPSELCAKTDAKRMLTEYNEAKDKGGAAFFFKKISTALSLKFSGLKTIEDSESALNSIITMQNCVENLKAAKLLKKAVKFWDCEKTDFSEFSSLYDSITVLKKITENEDGSNAERISNFVREAVISGGKILKNPACEKFVNRFAAFYEKVKKYNEIASAGKEIGEEIEKAIFEGVSDSFKELTANKSGLRDWCAFQKSAENARKAGLENIVARVLSFEIIPEKIEEYFAAEYFGTLCEYLFYGNEVLKNHSDSDFADLVSEFKRKDEELKKETIPCICSELSKGIPGIDSANLTLQWKFLRREMQKQRQIKPVRILLSEAFEAVQKLTPCFMMSPLSVAQYLPVDKDSFDVVIFDEASQITVWDAIGTLSRANEVIVAGDSKQMPPANFFAKTSDFEEEYEGIDEDMESILDELTAGALPVMRLKGHYRSKCESLIRFSNVKYYDGSLITYPSANTVQKSVKYEFIENGLYERNNGINRPEAERVVKECVKRLTNPDKSVSGKSIGVVTFNGEQQKLIEDLLDKERENHPEIEFAFSPENPEPVFVKNLETVQGDERDIIFFSTTFGPDKDGKMLMNFGPLNRQGGERRLNVAVTRAKYEMTVFSSMSPDMIDLSRTKAAGVADLKDFLSYAKGNANVLKEKERNENTRKLSGFERNVVNTLEARGYKVDTMLGVSDTGVNIAIVSDENPDKYAISVDCDGSVFYNAKSETDREITRPGMLKGLGWNIARISAASWYYNREAAEKKLFDDIKKSLNKEKA